MNNQWRFKGNELKYVKDVLDSGEGSSTTGSYNKAFEELFASKSSDCQSKCWGNQFFRHVSNWLCTFSRNMASSPKCVAD